MLIGNRDTFFPDMITDYRYDYRFIGSSDTIWNTHWVSFWEITPRRSRPAATGSAEPATSCFYCSCCRRTRRIRLVLCVWCLSHLGGSENWLVSMKLRWCGVEFVYVREGCFAQRLSPPSPPKSGIIVLVLLMPPPHHSGRDSLALCVVLY